MTKRQDLFPVLFLAAFLGAAGSMKAQKGQPKMPVVRVRVDMVQLDVAVTNKEGYYVTGLSPYNFAIYEDDIRQKIATFGEENEAPRKLEDFRPGESKPKLVEPLSAKKPEHPPDRVSSLVAGANVFILFDTSNYMYRSFVFAQDSIAEFVRYLDHPDQVAFYSYSRDVSRVCRLTPDRSLVVRKVRTAVAGDDAALYNALLLTLKDAGKVSGRKVLVVFSNGPDNSSMVSPEDVRELAQSEGIPIYMVSTREAEDDPISSAIFKRISASTGGKAYFARHWRDQQRAFASIHDDLAHLYTLSYYPQPNPNLGWRRITVKLVGKDLKKYNVRTRSGYRPRLVRASTWTRTAEESGPAPANTITNR
jgi:Ca-activated chloride channel family protein